MKVVLLTEVKGMGKRGETKEVSEGYYRNFLAPKQLAVPPTDRRAAQVLKEVASKQQAAAEEVQRMRQLAGQFDGRTIELTAKAQGTQAGDKLFGAIHETQVAEALGIDKKQIKMTPIKTVGQHRVTLEFPHQLRATITVVVQPASR